MAGVVMVCLLENKQTNRSVVSGAYFKIHHLPGRGSISQGCRRRLVHARAHVYSAGFAYFSNDRYSKLILTLQKMLLGFMQLMAIKELCWGDMCPFWREFNYCLSEYSVFNIANCALIV